MGNRWLRAGGVAPMNKTSEEDDDKSVAMKSVTTNKDPVKSGITSSESLVVVGVNSGVTGGVHDKNKKLANISQDNAYIESENSEENNEIIFTDPKRRRMAHESKNPDANMSHNPDKEEMEDSMLELNQNKKNLNMAGTAVHSFQSL